MVLARPTLGLFLFSDAPWTALGAGAAEVIEAYVATIGSDTLKTRVSAAGQYRPFSERQLVRDMTVLRKPDSGQKAARLLYDSDPEGWVGSYGVSFYGLEPDPDLAEPEETNMLHLSFSIDTVDDEPDSLVELAARLASRFDVSYGFAGYCLRRTEGTIQSAVSQVNALLPRFLAVDPCYLPMRFSMKGRSFGAHWIDLVGPALARELGGAEAIVAGVPNAEISDLPSGGLMLRNANRPPLGDVNRLARDIGTMPDAARILKLSRSRLSGLGDADFDAQDWLARFDNRECEPWNNSP
jgi:hypothetical protein